MRCLTVCATLVLYGCVTLPPEPVPRALYLDLRKIIDANEDGGWTVDWLRLQANAEPALRSVCQVEPSQRDALDAWLSRQITRAGGPAEHAYREGGKSLDSLAEALSLERTRALLSFATNRASQDCPFWLAPDPRFTGVQTDAERWVILGETQAFVTLTLPSNIPAIGGGGRLFLGHGVGPRLTLAVGGDVAASGTFIPNGASHGIDAYVTLATPVLLRLTRFSQLYDLELAPVVLLENGRKLWPPGARIALAYGSSSVRMSRFMSYFTVYVAYDLHAFGGGAAIEHTLQLGTRLSLDLAL